MSMQDYETAKQMMSDAETDFDGSKAEYLIEKAEQVLHLKFPPTYRRFLSEFGCGGVEGFELYGIIGENFENSGIPDAIWYTLQLRKSIHLDLRLVVIAVAGDGCFYAIDTSDNDCEGEGSVSIYSIDGSTREKVASSFGAFLLKQVQNLARK
ncbi:MAG TPA: SMI1/KNR4 family protein [Prosthecobacter sp.]|jgi:hypothetical protein|nr:SMI1/KNR4 family protein [Prosthecobacter sp.]